MAPPRLATRATLAGVTLLALAVPLPAVAAPEDAGRSPRADLPADPDRSGMTAYAPPTGGARVPEQVLVRFAPRTSGAQQRSVLGEVGAATDATVPGTGFVAVDVAGADPQAVADALAADPRVAEVQVDHVRTAFAWTDDPALGLAWPYLDLVRAPRAWEAAAGADVTIAVLDTGVDATHEDLAGAVLPGTDLVDHDADPSDPQGHGTMVAGIAAARGDNGIGSVGTAHRASILPVRVLDADGFATDSTVAAGIAWATSHGADVVNLSLGGDAPSPVLAAAIRGAVDAGVVVVAAAGNDGDQSPMYPAAYAPQIDGLLAVTATDDAGALTTFSNTGDWVTLAAPGDRIIGPGPGQAYLAGTGTSFAAPSVAGAAALVLSHETGLGPAQVEARLVGTARDAGPKGIDPFYGAGVLDAASAVTATDARPAALAVPIDRAPGDAVDRWRSDDDTIDPAPLSLAAQHVRTLSPENDLDWTQLDVQRGWYDVRVRAGGDLDPRVEVQDADGDLLGRVDDFGDSDEATVRIRVRDAGPVLVGVSQRNGAASASPYTVDVEAADQPLFTQGDVLAGTDGSTGVAVGDVDGDDVADIVAGTLPVHVFRGAAAGGFGAAETLSVPGSGARVERPVVADLDADGDDDVAVPTSEGVQLALGGPDGLTLGAVLTTTAPRLVGGDVDGDGDVDLVAGDDTSARVLVNDGAARFTAGAGVTGSLGVRLALGDVDGDGRLDAVGTHAVSLQRPDGTFAAPLTLAEPGTLWLHGVEVADVTGDGRVEILRTRSDPPAVLVSSVTGGAVQTREVPAVGGPGPKAIATADVDGDGRTDVLTSSSGGLLTFLQRADGTLAAPLVSPSRDDASHEPCTLATVDADRDGLLDVVELTWTGVAVRTQSNLDAPPTEAGWFGSFGGRVSHSSGEYHPAKPFGTEFVFFRRALDATSVTPGTVRLVDMTTGADVPATRVYDTTGSPRVGTIQVRPTVALTPGRTYQVVIDGVRDPGGAVLPRPIRRWFTEGASGDRFTPVEPVRVLDTRRPEYGGPVWPGNWERLNLSAHVPADATAVVLSVAATRQDSLGNVRVFPRPSGYKPPPVVANLNVVPGVDQPNLVTVQLGVEQSVVLLGEGMRTHLVVDLFGYYAPGGAAAFAPATPTRVLDTRDGTGVRPGAVTGGHWVDLDVAGANGVPDDASAVVLNVAGTAVTGRTFVSVYPTPDLGSGVDRPTTSNLNLYPGRDQANLVTVKIGEGGRVRFWVDQASTHLVADLAGYYSETAPNGFEPLAPTRIGDTRNAVAFPGRLAAGTPVDITLAGSDVPPRAVAFVANVAGVHPDHVTHVRAFPTTSPASLPDVATINLVPGRDESNLAVLRLGVDRKVTFYSHSSRTDLVVDAFGYFATFD
ncbi:S8 family serine peptidase [Cellulomonas sp. H30R-01]|uniref:S8 family serine peptidase n=1 Tax=Cellulomonas sp. H30R-01 TaxID=2704467 RepID=UPI00138C0830|nr:S8 family serine peptidase [Cellulomonas sp. H30R-01]QHT57758.1 S8 family serine peptidase [Cellulomonas sp. H30R-01]